MVHLAFGLTILDTPLGSLEPSEAVKPCSGITPDVSLDDIPEETTVVSPFGPGLPLLDAAVEFLPEVVDLDVPEDHSPGAVKTKDSGVLVQPDDPRMSKQARS